MPRPRELPDAEKRELVRAFKDHGTFCRESLVIDDLEGSRVALEMGAGQRKLSEAWDRQEKAGKPVRIIVLKTRRSWFTTGACAEIFHRVPFFPGRKGVIIADHYRPAGMEAFGYLDKFQERYVPFTRFDAAIELPDLIKNSEQRMEWANGAAIDVYSADTGEIRGGGRHFALFDEVAFWRAAEVTLTGAMNMVPKKKGTAVIVMSTANGIGGEFYDLWKAAQDPLSDTLFECLFFGWLEHEQYTAPLEVEPNAFLQSLNKEERTLYDVHNATLEQLQWRRLTIATECRGKVELFHQEYPTTAEEAFISSGHPVFDMEALARHPVVEPTDGDLHLIEEPTHKRLLYIPKPHGELQIFKKPEKGKRYVIGADPSKGRDVSEAQRGQNPDFSVAFVADKDTGEQVAMWRGRIRPGPFGEGLALLARYYNYAYLVPENNDAGFIDAIVRANYPIELIYHHQRDPTDKRPGTIQEIGFETTELTRDWLIGAGDDAIRSMTLTIHSAICVNECQTFVRKPNGKKEHMSDHHDDCVFAMSLAEIGRRFAPRKWPPLFDAGTQGVTAKPSFYGRKRNRDEEE